LLQLWDLESDDAVALAGHTGAVRAVQWSPCGTQLLSAADDMDVRFWDVHTVEEGSSATVGCHDRRGTCICGRDQFGQTVRKDECPVRGHAAPVTCVRFAPQTKVHVPRPLLAPASGR
jgi:WD40 repeat protein